MLAMKNTFGHAVELEGWFYTYFSEISRWIHLSSQVCLSCWVV